MGSFLKCSNGLFGFNLRKTVLLCSVIMMLLYAFIVYYNIIGKLYFNVGVILYALVFTLLLLIGIRKDNNPNTFLTCVYHYGYLFYIMFKTIFVLSFTFAVIHKFDHLLDYCRIVTLYVLELIYYVYARSYILEINEIIKEAQNIKNLEQQINSSIEE